MAVTKKQRDNAYAALCRAVFKYVHLKGGSVLMAEGIQIQEWPTAQEGSFTVAVKCLGRKPAFAERKANDDPTAH